MLFKTEKEHFSTLHWDRVSLVHLEAYHHLFFLFQPTEMRFRRRFKLNPVKRLFPMYLLARSTLEALTTRTPPRQMVLSRNFSPKLVSTMPNCKYNDSTFFVHNPAPHLPHALPTGRVIPSHCCVFTGNSLPLWYLCRF
jgi:hypothetical protein